MTFKQLKKEVGRYNFGPGARVSAHDRGDGYAELRMVIRRPDAERWRKNQDQALNEIRARETIVLTEALLSDVRPWLEGLWGILWQHEMHEFMTYRGRAVHHPHDHLPWWHNLSSLIAAQSATGSPARVTLGSADTPPMASFTFTSTMESST